MFFSIVQDSCQPMNESVIEQRDSRTRYFLLKNTCCSPHSPFLTHLTCFLIATHFCSSADLAEADRLLQSLLTGNNYYSVIILKIRSFPS